ncbi:conserved hypothetical protein [Thermotomaculum hydrothermale]|uniref:Pel9A-like right handed beta-helix region domain-containing protein n=1 Tax=Thermotomaculum hydrothermale TaxID=981385 RepID=A0A7R6PDE8_9BACT|nr:right-handed parallel beta-helix repeat-containing protein [Thermotomaculum hydrothermale]BBB31698.1 conserved hypothetical protein [Thermotomaculum hydrothermale]
MKGFIKFFLVLTMFFPICTYLTPFSPQYKGNILIVSPDGDDVNGDGSVDNPFKTLDTALFYAKQGDTVYLRGGVYPIEVNIDVSGNSRNPITISSYPGEHAIFDGTIDENSDSNPPKFRITGDYLIVENIEVRNGGSDGVLLTEGASHNILKNIKVHHCYFAGIEIENGAGYNLVLNCDSYMNCDYRETHGEHADGFGVKFNVGRGNVLKGCRAWNNSDDGFDMWEANNKVTIEYCIAWGNGFDSWGIGGDFAGDGNGFKLGPGGHLIHHCIAFLNASRGFDFNDAEESLYVYNNSSYKNPVGFNFPDGKHVLKNNLSFRDGRNTVGMECVQERNSWQYDSVSESAFVSLDYSVVIGERKADGSIPQNNFFKPSLYSPYIDKGVDVGLLYYGNAPEIGAVEIRIFRIIIPKDPLTTPALLF